ncbi:RidA family protein [Gluconacetobacter tumulisoli]|uniref:RidA family protein n=1 Tax=Gluconacetobacter tumulisoli TaxID=1286189 RepID=A0A7W4PKW9_9PROT|nr:RidA family protein [Gluconacetobacter tumulisoli]MBB2201520.1 RidA family protein [Gluconacetobacter tumulisoli]
MSRIAYGAAHVPLSPAVRAGDFVYVSGQVPVRDGAIVGADVAEQTRVVLDNVAAALALAGCAMSDVVKTFAILTDAGDFAAFNAAYAAYFPIEPPARTTIEAGLMIDIRVEIEAVAYKPSGA